MDVRRTSESHKMEYAANTDTLRNKRLSDLIEMLRTAITSAEELAQSAEDYDYDYVNPKLLHTIAKAKAILKELDENADIL